MTFVFAILVLAAIGLLLAALGSAIAGGRARQALAFLACGVVCLVLSASTVAVGNELFDRCINTRAEKIRDNPYNPKAFERWWRISKSQGLLCGPGSNQPCTRRALRLELNQLWVEAKRKVEPQCLNRKVLSSG